MSTSKHSYARKMAANLVFRLKYDFRFGAKHAVSRPQLWLSKAPMEGGKDTHTFGDLAISLGKNN